MAPYKRIYSGFSQVFVENVIREEKSKDKGWEETNLQFLKKKKKKKTSTSRLIQGIRVREREG